MDILCIMHADFETPGVIEDWARENNHTFNILKFYQGKTYSKTPYFDFLIVMGGPQSPLDIEQAPYLRDEIVLIQQAVKNNKIMLGFCLGAQLIGEALGAPAQRSPEKEVGVFPIYLTDEGLKSPILKGFPRSFNVIHWHNDMPGLTKDAKILGFSEGCPRQIVRYSEKIYGFQCHLEITLEGIQTMIKACPLDLKTSQFTQTPDELNVQNYKEINARIYQILDKFSTL